MDVLVLGPVQVWADGVAVTVDRPLERALLVRLALAQGVPVPDSRLAEELWGSGVERPVQRLRVVVSRLRTALGEHAGVVGRTPAGYHAAVRAHDLLGAETAAQRLHTAQRNGDQRAVASAAREALALWRGDALADLRTIPYAAAEGERLDDWRLTLTVAGLAANLELGAAGEVVTELTGLVARHPVHEPLSCLLAIALYRTGRQVDALERLARLRRVLADDLGVDPAPDTAELERRILNHDPALRWSEQPLSDSATTQSVTDEVGRRLGEVDRVATGDGVGGTAEAGAGNGMGAVVRAGAGNGVGATAGVNAGESASAAEYADALEGSRHGVDPGLGRAVPTTSFVGRGREFATLAARVSAPCLITLVGPAGGGKSRLATEIARAAAHSGRVVVLVELAPVRRADDVLPAVAAALERSGLLVEATIDPDALWPAIIAAAIGATFGPGADAATGAASGLSADQAAGADRAANGRPGTEADQAANAQPVAGVDPADEAGRQTSIDRAEPGPAAVPSPGVLLVLDNAEHLVEPVAELVRTLRLPSEKGSAAGQLGPSVLLTSQVPLGVPGESTYPLGSLDRGVGVALFLERAGLHGLVTPAEREQVVAICAAVDWLPLGIELAAGLTRTLSIAQLAQRIDDRVRLLVGGVRTATDRRHTSLRVALDWSYELLDDREQAVLRRLGVFAGGFTLEAAEAVVPIGDLEVGDIAPALADLVNRSLVTVHTDGTTRRFVLLETIRDYAQARTAQRGESDPLRTHHLTWCLDLVRTIGTSDDFANAESVAAVFAEWPNILAALEYAPGSAAVETGLQLANAMHVPWLARASFREAQRHYGALIAALDALPTEPVSAAELALALSQYGFHTLMSGRLDAAAEQLARAGALAAPLDDHELAQTVRYYQGIVDIERCRLPDAVARLQEGERLAERVTQAASFADALGTALLYSGDAAGALAAYARSTLVDRENGDEHGLSRGLSNQAKALLDLGRTADALALADESDTYARRLDDRQILPLNDLTRAAAALAAGQLDAAESYCRAALAHEENAPGLARVDLADVLVGKGELAQARDLLAVFDADEPAGVTWLANRSVAVALMRAEGNAAAARQLLEQARSEYAAAGFGWHRYAARVLG